MTIPLNETSAMVMSIMIATFEALLVFLLFLPGFITQRTIEILSPRKERDWFGRLVSGAVLTLLIYAFYIAFIAIPSGLPMFPAEVNAQQEAAISVEDDSAPAEPQTAWQIHYHVAGIILAISIGLGLVIGRSMDKGTFYAVLRAEYVTIPKPDDKTLKAGILRVLRWLLRFTSATGRDTVWEDALHVRRSHFVKVTLRNGRTILGRYLHYSDNPRIQDLWIIKPEQALLPGHPPAVLIAEPGSTDYRPVLSSAGVLITDRAMIETIEFIGDIRVDSEHGEGEGTPRRANKAPWWQKGRRRSSRSSREQADKPRHETSDHR